MGTRSLTRVFDDKAQVMNMYRQMDGYPSGHGQALFDFLDGLVVVNGYTLDTTRRVANGAGCLAAQLVAHFKHGVGGFYLYPPSARDCGQEYEYHITVSELTMHMKVYECRWRADKPPTNHAIFGGDIAGFGEFCKKKEYE